MKLRPLIWVMAFVLVAVLGYWLAGTAAGPAENVKKTPAAVVANRARVVDDSMPKFRAGERVAVAHGDLEAEIAGALAGQRVIAFKDRAALEAFLKNAGSNIHVIGRLDALNALRIGFADPADLLGLLDGSENQSMIFPVYTPIPKDGTVQSGAVAMGNHLLGWLGIPSNNSDWGKGVSIAILDTGVTANAAFNSNIRMINMVPLPADAATQNGHATAVASMIIGGDPLTPGVAPGADILSVRIANDNGQSDSFLLAKGIVAAVDAGVQLINVSMGSTGDSGVVKSAVEYALARGVLIFAAAGNNGTNEVSYPAANHGVIAVGAVDALGNHLDFSNTGASVAVSAPGYGLNAAWPGDQAASVTGTSFSTPIVVGAVADLMSQSGTGMTAVAAWQLLEQYLNDGGAAGADPELGAGMPDVGRALAGSTPGIYDAALASSRILAADAGNPNGQIEVLVQNRGTETLVNTAVQVNTGTSVITSNITSLAPDAVTTVRIPIARMPAQTAAGLRVDARVVLSGGVKDAKPSNDRRIETYVPATVH